MESTSIEKQESSQIADMEKPKPVLRPGMAPIKEEFILVGHKPQIQAEYISPALKESLAQESEGGNTESKDDRDAESSAEPPNKKAKLRGRNKQRPNNKNIKEKDRMCPSVKEDRDCKFGENCKFNHDKEDFMANKKPDLGEDCVIFEKFGFCKYSLTCRFAKKHLTEDFKNMTDKDKIEQSKNEKEINDIDPDVKKQLWKRKYNFSKADSIWKPLQAKLHSENKHAKDKNNENPNSEKMHENGQPPENELLKSSNIAEKKDESLDETTCEKSCNPTDQMKVENPIPDASIKKDLEVRTTGQITDEEIIPLRSCEKKKLDLKNKLYLAPLTTVGNLPYRRVCKDLGVDVTCGEMALATQLLQAKQSEWSLLKRHPCEDVFGVQICGGYPDTMTRCAQLLTETCNVDFIDINCGCPIDLIYKKGGGSALMSKVNKLETICSSMLGVMGDTPLTVKLRTGVFDNKNIAHTVIPRLRDIGVSMVTLHGRSREQRYTKQADWDYINECAMAGSPMPVFGNGDILSWEDAHLHMQSHGVSGVMVARGALIKPWIFTEIKEQRHWDISSGERLDILRSFTNYGLEHWGSDHQGVETTRRFLLEWLSFTHRYIPVGVLERLPQRINERPPYYQGRDDLETLMASQNCGDWVKITEMLLGPVPSTFRFLPKHKANAYA